MKAIFDTKPTSMYDDDISNHYHFPTRYLKLADQCLGDWVILRRPRADGGNLAYFAAAHVGRIEPDPNNAGHSYARFDDFVAFNRPVPWQSNGKYAELALREIPKKQVGVFLRGRSVRTLNEADFSAIVKAGAPEANIDRFGLAKLE